MASVFFGVGDCPPFALLYTSHSPPTVLQLLFYIKTPLALQYAVAALPLQAMGVYIASINSGSNGNCYYVGNEEEAVLIDAGISCRETVKRMKRLGLPVDRVKAIFISHEHTDHISGLEQLSKQFSLPVYITPGTLRGSSLKIEDGLIKGFTALQPVPIGNLTITAFTKHHDAGDPHSFVVECNNIRVGVITDIGICCENVVKHFSGCHAAFLEANYDVDMLEGGGYPYHLKKRISGGKGHISNIQALELFNKHRPPYMSHLILSHLSHNNNNPQIVQQLFQQHAGATNIVVASRHQETELFYITGAAPEPLPMRTKARARSKAFANTAQLSLFQ